MYVFCTLSTRGMPYTHAPHTMCKGKHRFSAGMRSCHTYNAFIYPHCTLNELSMHGEFQKVKAWKRAKSTKNSQKQREKSENIYRYAIDDLRFWHPSRAQCLFFRVYFGNFRVIDGDTQHERLLFRWPTWCLRAASKRETKKAWHMPLGEGSSLVFCLCPQVISAVHVRGQP